MKTALILLTFILSPVWPLAATPGDPSIIVNKETNEGIFVQEGKILQQFTVATGESAELTPEGEFTITVKAKNPYYRRKNIPGGDPENPLGTRWMGFDARGTDGRIYGLHGTNRESSIGQYVTQGCIRLHKDAIEALYEKIPLGTKVIITSSPYPIDTIARQKGMIK
ncbi:L,D-transpeptidase [Priestia koreensis]|uniref:L,D-transpeptidase n=1 Tax=Priestia koreensis TaxID=284581 RepID=UPI0034596E09